MNIGLVAHDSKKKLMQNFCIAYRGILSRHELFATGSTGRLIEEVTNLNIHKFLVGELGGVQQLAAQINSRKQLKLTDILKFPWDADTAPTTISDDDIKRLREKAKAIGKDLFDGKTDIQCG